MALVGYSDYWYLVGLVANKIGLHPGGMGHMAHKVQISSVALWQDLRRRGLTPKKSLTISALDVPDEGFAPFFRGVSTATEAS